MNSIEELWAGSNKLIEISENVFSESYFSKTAFVNLARNPLSSETMLLLKRQLGNRLSLP